VLGLAYDTGDGEPTDIAHALTLYRMACDDDYAMGCASLGDSYRFGHGVAKDTTRAAEFYQKACRMGLKSACDDAAHLR